MRLTRPQLLWKFQVYLDQLQIHDEERRTRLSEMYLERALSRSTERDFTQWLKSNKVMPPDAVIMRTRGSRLSLFTEWLDRHHFLAPDPESRQRLTRFHFDGTLRRDLQISFHRFCREKTAAGDTRRLPT